MQEKPKSTDKRDSELGLLGMKIERMVENLLASREIIDSQIELLANVRREYPTNLTFIEELATLVQEGETDYAFRLKECQMMKDLYTARKLQKN